MDSPLGLVSLLSPESIVVYPELDSSAAPFIHNAVPEQCNHSLTTMPAEIYTENNVHVPTMATIIQSPPIPQIKSIQFPFQPSRSATQHQCCWTVWPFCFTRLWLGQFINNINRCMSQCMLHRGLLLRWRGGKGNIINATNALISSFVQTIIGKEVTSAIKSTYIWVLMPEFHDDTQIVDTLIADIHVYQGLSHNESRPTL